MTTEPRPGKSSWHPDSLTRLGIPEAGKLVQVLLERYLERGPRFEDMRTALDEGDLERLRLAAHSLRSSSLQVGAAEVADHLERLESSLSAGAEVDRGRLRDTVDGAERAYLAVRRDMQAHLSSPTTEP